MSKENNNYNFAKEAYLRLGDIKSLLELNVKFQKWNEAIFFVKQNPELNEYLYYNYAQHLV